MNSKHFVLAALCTAAVSFSACSDDDEPGNLPQPQPTPPSGEVVLQGDTVSVYGPSTRLSRLKVTTW